MKILTFRRLIGLAALGGFAYVHRQRGGEWNMASVKGTLRELWSSANNRANQVKDQVRDAAGDTMGRVSSASSSSMRGGSSEERSTSSPSYNYGGRNDDNNRY